MSVKRTNGRTLTRSVAGDQLCTHTATGCAASSGITRSVSRPFGQVASCAGYAASRDHKLVRLEIDCRASPTSTSPRIDDLNGQFNVGVTLGQTRDFQCLVPGHNAARFNRKLTHTSGMVYPFKARAARGSDPVGHASRRSQTRLGDSTTPIRKLEVEVGRVAGRGTLGPNDAERKRAFQSCELRVGHEIAPRHCGP
jgi:hypothetical protein